MTTYSEYIINQEGLYCESYGLEEENFQRQQEYLKTIRLKVRTKNITKSLILTIKN